MEYLKTRYEPANNIPSPRFQAVGGYVQASLYLVPKKFQIVLKQETFDPNDDISRNQTDTTTLGLNYYIHGHDLKLMADYLRVKAGRLDSQDKVLARFADRLLRRTSETERSGTMRRTLNLIGIAALLARSPPAASRPSRSTSRRRRASPTP